MYDVARTCFPAGLTSRILQRAREQDIECHIRDMRQKLPGLDPSIDLSWLHNFQLECVKTFARRTRGIGWLPTGSGKGEIAVATAYAIPVNWLFVVNETDLMLDIAARWERRTRMPAGRLGDGHRNLTPRFTAATFQSLASGLRRRDPAVLELVDQAQGLIIDEVHTTPSASYYAVAQSIDAYYRIGLSGTPLARGDNRALYAVGTTGSVVYRVQPDDLIARGFISKPLIELVEHPHPTSRAKTYRAGYTEQIVKNNARNGLLVRLVERSEKPALLFVKDLAHGRELMQRLKARNIRAEFVWGKKSVAQRQAAIRRLVWGDLDVIVCNIVFQSGTDIPELASVINGAAGKSVIAAIQRVGRGMRVVRNEHGEVIKGIFHVADIFDRDGGWHEKHAQQRFAAYQREGYETKMVKV